ncbi:hypothetical protein [Mesorhizobium sp.]|uniref:hypothetical protein n=1 Tax=Mesorhizobium sp. TaxID=1871066 RepID=UPI000FE2B74E|nr:hypothetical protein [Mesorhizobium sp.]RWC06582.1 MAG: hypothetical protein EOQ56_03370 [Mesorhizobium sp.]RWQ15175.1 MAG: hypothetical protein EOR92_25230 [Mesorhizobium sp.]
MPVDPVDPVDIDRLEDNPVDIPKGGIKYFDIVGNNLLTADLEFYASFDQAGAKRDNEIKIYVDEFGSRKKERLPMIAEATEKADNNANKVRWVVIKLNGNIADTEQGLRVI